ncbi:hypothetical protein HOO65_020769 [Ceratocystis lukuohia]|uniref:PEX14-like helix-turn-helix domain-containing protein n=1 Tax=Ceratocystis lukuohia TaxID=2019550 RepID=A0ABR4MPL7_9PEZI
MNKTQDAITDKPTAGDDLFIAFDSYPWNQDPRFAALVKSMASRGMPMTTGPAMLVARTAFATKFLGLAVDKEAYTAWARGKGPENDIVDQRLAQGFAMVGGDDSDNQHQKAGTGTGTIATATAAINTLDWQAAAPKLAAVVDRSSESAGDPNDMGNGQPPAKFAELLRFMQEGTPIPGNIKPFGARTVPRKPWEHDDPQKVLVGSDATLTSVDSEFPSLEAENPKA